nr:MAG: hypothetical protein 1 [Yunnan farmland cysto-like virus]
MSIYIIPSDGDFQQLTEVTTRAEVPLLTPQTLREFILATNGLSIAVVTMSAENMLVLSRHAATLVDEIPTVVMSVPGAAYTGEWMMLASYFPPMDWIELERKLKKSGHMATTPGSLEKRTRQPLAPTVGQTFTARMQAAQQDQPASNIAEEEDELPEGGF